MDQQSTFNIELVSAPSILGLRFSGVEELSESLLAAGLGSHLQVHHAVRHVDTLNEFYNTERDAATNCLNPQLINQFSLILSKVVTSVIEDGRFPFVLGGDCSVLIGIMPALKLQGEYGLIFLDAHADFYEPERSTTGEVADMDLGIVTGRGPSILTNINNLAPYVKDENVIHIGQRDIEETKKYGSRDIRETNIKCFSLAEIEEKGLEEMTTAIVQHAQQLPVKACWIHFDTDVLSDDINPAVDYRLPGGLSFNQVEYLLQSLLASIPVAGISVTCFNPRLDTSGQIANNLVQSLGRAFNNNVEMKGRE
jgi:arginase